MTLEDYLNHASLLLVHYLLGSCYAGWTLVGLECRDNKKSLMRIMLRLVDLNPLGISSSIASCTLSEAMSCKTYISPTAVSILHCIAAHIS